MADNKIPADVVSTAQMPPPGRGVPRPSMTSRLTARLRAGRLDRLIAVGVPAPAGSALAAHEARLTSSAEREAIARALRRCVADASGRRHPAVVTDAFAYPEYHGAEDVIDAITLRLHSPRPVSARGMARLRQILADGTGPLYRFGRGDLNGRLGAALAAL